MFPIPTLKRPLPTAARGYAGCAVALLLTLACSALPSGLGGGSRRPSGVKPVGPAPVVDPGFSGESAFVHLEALYAFGPRPAGSDALAQAHEYVAAQFLNMGAEVRRLGATQSLGPEGPEVDLHILTAEFEGERPDAIMLVAPLDTAPVEGIAFAGASEGASGAAVLIELARALTEGGAPLPYTLQFIFPDGDRLRPRRDYGSHVLVNLMREIDALKQLRAVVYLDSVGDRDLVIVRDGNSNRRLRRLIFSEAPKVGREDVFSSESGFETPSAGHVHFARRGIPAVLITDAALGAGDPPGLAWHTEEDTPEICSPDSLEAVGDVLISAIELQTRRWARVDATRPAEELESPPAAATDDGPEADAAAVADDAVEAVADDAVEAVADDAVEAVADDAVEAMPTDDAAEAAPTDEAPALQEDAP